MENLPSDYSELRSLAEDGNAEAQKKLGDIFVLGLSGKQKNYEHAAHWYGKSAGQNNAKAQKCLGNMYANGVGVVQSYEKAFLLYEASAAQGNSKAIFNLSLMYQIGHHTDKNYEKAYSPLNLFFDFFSKYFFARPFFTR